MIAAWRYVSGVQGRTDVEPHQLGKAIDATNAVVWVDCVSPEVTDLEWLKRELGIGPVVVDALINAEQSTKLLRYGDYFHVAVHDCEFRDGALERREIDIVMGPGWLVTVRHPTEGSTPIDVAAIAREFELQRTEHSKTEEGFLLWALFDVIIDRYFNVNDAID